VFPAVKVKPAANVSVIFAPLLPLNPSREKVVPEAVIDSMMERWEVPAPHEADEVEYWIDGRRLTLY
jgi:tRNA uridine 5-carbamoylmethylation protein Kti12